MVEEYYPVSLTAVLARDEGPALLMSDELSDKHFLIIILVQDADMIAQICSMRAENVSNPRPTTYELFGEVLTKANAHLSSVRITKIDESQTFCAELDLFYGEEYVPMTARVSDAIGLAITFEAPILVAKQVLEEAGVIGFEIVPEGESSSELGVPDGKTFFGEVSADDTLSKSRGGGWGGDENLN